MLPEPFLSFDDRPDSPEEACGVFGVIAPNEDIAKLVYFGLYALQHRGQESAGIVSFDTQKDDPLVAHAHKAMGLVSQVFDEKILERLTGSIAIGHTRVQVKSPTLSPWWLKQGWAIFHWRTMAIWSMPPR
jgi:amidophosphoribosyltransferase